MPSGPEIIPQPKIRRPMVCEACDDHNHQMCANPQVCMCAFRGHPEPQ